METEQVLRDERLNEGQDARDAAAAAAEAANNGDDDQKPFITKLRLMNLPGGDSHKLPSAKHAADYATLPDENKRATINLLQAFVRETCKSISERDELKILQDLVAGLVDNEAISESLELHFAHNNDLKLRNLQRFCVEVLESDLLMHAVECRTVAAVLSNAFSCNEINKFVEHGINKCNFAMALEDTMLLCNGNAPPVAVINHVRYSDQQVNFAIDFIIKQCNFISWSL